MRLPALSLILLALAAGAAHAETSPTPRKFLRTWDLGRDGEGEDTCTVTLRRDPVIGGFGVTRRRDCRRTPGDGDLLAWRPTADGGVAFSDAQRRTVHAFKLDPGYRPRGWGFDSHDAAGRLWIMNVHGRPPPPERSR